MIKVSESDEMVKVKEPGLLAASRTTFLSAFTPSSRFPNSQNDHFYATFFTFAQFVRNATLFRPVLALSSRSSFPQPGIHP